MVLKKVHRVIKFNQNAWLKPDIDMNTDLRKKQKVTLKKIIYLNKFIKKFIKNHLFKKKKFTIYNDKKFKSCRRTHN